MVTATDRRQEPAQALQSQFSSVGTFATLPLCRLADVAAGRSRRAKSSGDANCGRNCLGRLMPGATVHPSLKRK